jgi:hypothetical protein
MEEFELPFPRGDNDEGVNTTTDESKDLAHVGKGGSYVRVQGAGHDIQDTRPAVVLSTIDQVWSKALAK